MSDEPPQHIPGNDRNILVPRLSSTCAEVADLAERGLHGGTTKGKAKEIRDKAWDSSGFLVRDSKNGPRHTKSGHAVGGFEGLLSNVTTRCNSSEVHSRRKNS